MAYTIVYSREAERQFKALGSRTERAIKKKVTRYLSHQPDQAGNRRKRLRPNALAEWELRLDDWRVLYNIFEDEEEVLVVAVGEKRHEKLYIDGEEVKW